MKFEMEEMFKNGEIVIYNLDEDGFYIEKNGEKFVFDSTYEARFNTLISLFALKNEWVECNRNFDGFNLIFEDKGKKQCYSFSKTFPDNWLLFNSYLYNLIGESYE